MQGRREWVGWGRTEIFERRGDDRTLTRRSDPGHPTASARATTPLRASVNSGSHRRLSKPTLAATSLFFLLYFEHFRLDQLGHS